MKQIYIVVADQISLLGWPWIYSVTAENEQDALELAAVANESPLHNPIAVRTEDYQVALNIFLKAHHAS